VNTQQLLPTNTMLGCCGFTVGGILLLLFALWRYKSSKPSSPSSSIAIPVVQPSLPFLGNALQYKKSPHQFLIDSSRRYGGIFMINLAGMKTFILTSDSLLKQFDSISNSSQILSNHQAINDFGFGYTLGEFNVFHGTEIHKFVIKNYLTSSSNLQKIIPFFTQTIRKRFFTEVLSLTASPISSAPSGVTPEMKKEEIVIPNFLHFIRRVILGSIIETFLSSHFMSYYSLLISESEGRPKATCDVIDDFMAFQDEIETATATAAVLPQWLAVFVCLQRCQANRMILVKRFQIVIQAITADVATGKLSEEEAEGIWLKGMKSMQREGKGEEQGSYGTQEMAQLFIGLLFAAHKNPGLCPLPPLQACSSSL
jgi:hypothetical protein